MAIVVAIDGPSGSGKSSVSRGVARELGLRYLDTGAQYRAMTWWILQNRIDLADPAAIALASAKPLILSGTDPDGPTITVDGADVAPAIRGPEVTAAVSKVAAVQAVRDRLIALQRDLIARAGEPGPGIVVEGRDIADVVYPAAQTKVYLTASAAARAARRDAERGGTQGVALTERELARRDAEDARTTRPLDAAEGAIVVDATELDLEQVIAKVSGLVGAAR
ncbi:MAG TPA: (d)CMP kinase [Actinocrinis sp.]|nr:(d)CMP kinase [Actinocrinis sp.]